MIYITGDTHGMHDFSKLIYFRKENITSDDILIILGDAGIVWHRDTLDELINNYSSLGLTIFYIDGNHENFELLNMFPIVEKYGAKMHQISNNIYHVLRGEIMCISDKTFLCIGGAFSSDRKYRRLGSSYWMEEQITDEDIKNAKSNLKKVNNKVDYILIHCVDTITTMKYLDFRVSESTEKLLFIENEVEYKHWYFGHYHIDKEVEEKKRCFYYDILKIE